MRFVASKKCFVGGRRYRVGDVYTGDPETMPQAHFVEEESVVPESNTSPKEDPSIPEGAGLVTKADSISDLSISGKGKPSTVSKNAVDLANEMGVELENVEGTGQAGQITKSDVQRYVDENTPPAVDLV